MPNPTIREPVTELDPCGPDLRWDGEFLALVDAFEVTVAKGAASVVEGELVDAPGKAFDEVVEGAIALSRRTKDLRVLAVYVEARWQQAGLVGFADAMADLLAVQERWPGARDGIHPRAEESDDDLGERAAALGRLLNRIPTLAATIGWGASDAGDRSACVSTLRKVFDPWAERLQVAFGNQMPSGTAAWEALQAVLGTEWLAADQVRVDGDAPSGPTPRNTDAWDLIDEALSRMREQDHHSPALPLLRLLSTWRSLGIIEIVDRMTGSGVTLEQLMESVKRQIQS